MNIEYRITCDGLQKDIDDIHNSLKEYNMSKREKSDNVPLGIFLENEKMEKLAGITGETFGNWLCIRYLWVDGALRGRGIGRSLIEKAEAEAVKRGCRFAFVDTFDFQAPGFYEKLGYSKVFALEKYPYTGARYYYTKSLTFQERKK